LKSKIQAISRAILPKKQIRRSASKSATKDDLHLGAVLGLYDGHALRANEAKVRNLTA